MNAGLVRHHGGPDRHGPARWDFSTCANAAGPCPMAIDAVRAADPLRYPDPAHHALRHALAGLHGVAAGRIVIAASASEFIQRLSAVGARLAPGPVAVPALAYGDYAAAARACGRAVVADGDPGATLRWCAEPSSPLGRDSAPPSDPGRVPTVLDAVYAPLRLHGTPRWQRAARDAAFVLHSPNKALGLCGVRGAYAVAPRDAGWDVERWCDALAAAAPSWPLGAHAVAMLDAWTLPAVQSWVEASRDALRAWRLHLSGMLRERGFEVDDGVASFFAVRPPRPLAATALRAGEVALRDLASFGRPGWWRLSAQPPGAVDALARALDRSNAEVGA